MAGMRPLCQPMLFGSSGSAHLRRQRRGSDPQLADQLAMDGRVAGNHIAAV